jgi:hypothetical protein
MEEEKQAPLLATTKITRHAAQAPSFVLGM